MNPLQRHLMTAKLLNISYSSPSFKNSRTDVQIYTQDIGDDRFIVFPGTQSIRDWLTNFRMRSLVTPYQKEGYKGKVKLHEGYYNAYRSVQEEVLELAQTHLRLILGGHSSGAIAQIAGVDINYRLKKRVEVITFGSPAIGNKEWAISAGERIVATSYRNCLDIVPYLLFHNHHVARAIADDWFYFNPHAIGNYEKSISRLIKCYQ